MKKEIFSKFKKIRFKQIIYPLIITIFIILLIILLFSSIKFLSQNINRIFSSNTEAFNSQLLKLELDKFYFVAKRLGISIEQETAIETTPTPTPTIEPTTEPTPTPTPVELDKTSLKISVLNSTTTQGLAKTLKTSLEADGFSVQNTGNVSPPKENTIIKIKESKKIYSQSIKDVVSEQYALGEDETLEENNVYDVIIVIGKNKPQPETTPQITPTPTLTTEPTPTPDNP